MNNLIRDAYQEGWETGRNSTSVDGDFTHDWNNSDAMASQPEDVTNPSVVEGQVFRYGNQIWRITEAFNVTLEDAFNEAAHASATGSVGGTLENVSITGGDRVTTSKITVAVIESLDTPHSEYGIKGLLSDRP